ncbi:MAG: methyltransferase domain-containing protein [bacterium]
MPKNRMEKVKQHFSSESRTFDDLIVKVVPYYSQMIGAIINNLPFNEDKKIKVLDLGCGTGTISYLIHQRYPNMELTCVDVSQQMLEVAKDKLKRVKKVTFILGDFHSYRITGKFDAIVSSLALHHLESEQDRDIFYTSIYQSLKSGGIFINADIMKSDNAYFQKVNYAKWKEFGMRSLSADFIENTTFVKHREEDRCSTILKETDRLRKIGFKHIEIFWKYYNFATYGAIK